MTHGARRQGPGVDRLRPADGRRRDRSRSRADPERDATGTYDFALGQYGYNKQHVHLRHERRARVGFLIEGMHLGNTGFKDLDGGGDTGFTRNEWMAKASYDLDPRAAMQNELLLKLGYSDEVSNETYLGLTDADLRATPDRRYLASQHDRMEQPPDVDRAHAQAVDSRRELDDDDDGVPPRLHRIWRKVNGIRGADISDVLARPGRPRATRVYVGAATRRGRHAERRETHPHRPERAQLRLAGRADAGPRATAKTGPVAHRVDVRRARAQRRDRRASTRRTASSIDGAAQLVPDGRVDAGHGLQHRRRRTRSRCTRSTRSTWGPLTVTPGVRVEAIHAAYRRRACTAPRRARRCTRRSSRASARYWALTADFGVLAGVHQGFSPVAAGAGADRDAGGERQLRGRRALRRAGNARAEVIGFYNDYSNLTDICTVLERLHAAQPRSAVRRRSRAHLRRRGVRRGRASAAARLDRPRRV